MFKSNRHQAIEGFLNDEVERLALSLYKWRGRYYEVLTRTQTLRRHNWSQFVRLTGGYMVRELTLDMVKKYYPNILTTN